jgi:hypothetical protein
MKAKTIAKSNKHLGGDFDEFLKDKGILEDCEATPSSASSLGRSRR